MLNLDTLSTSTLPHLHNYEGEIQTLLSELESTGLSGIVLDMHEVDSDEKFFEVIKTKLNYPDSFGMNANALWDMLTGWGEPEKNRVLIFSNIDSLFRDSPSTLELLIEYFKNAGIVWAIPSNDSGMSHDSIPFNTVLHTSVYDQAIDNHLHDKVGGLYFDNIG